MTTRDCADNPMNGIYDCIVFLVRRYPFVNGVVSECRRAHDSDDRPSGLRLTAFFRTLSTAWKRTNQSLNQIDDHTFQHVERCLAYYTKYISDDVIDESLSLRLKAVLRDVDGALDKAALRTEKRDLECEVEKLKEQNAAMKKFIDKYKNRLWNDSAYDLGKRLALANEFEECGIDIDE